MQRHTFSITLLLALCVTGQVSGQVSAQPPGKRTSYDAVTVSDKQQDFAFALVSRQDGSNILSGSGADVRVIEAKRKALMRDFLWFRQGQKTYLIIDPDTVAQAQALWEPVRINSAAIEQLSKQIEVQSKLLQKNSEQIVAAQSRSRQLADSSAAADALALRRQIATLQAQRDAKHAEQAKLLGNNAEQLDQQLASLDQSIDAISEKIDRLYAQIDQLIETRQQDLDVAYDKKQREADQQMELLGHQMDQLGKQQDAAAKSAEIQLRALILHAIDAGMAQAGG